METWRSPAPEEIKLAEVNLEEDIKLFRDNDHLNLIGVGELNQRWGLHDMGVSAPEFYRLQTPRSWPSAIVEMWHTDGQVLENPLLRVGLIVTSHPTLIVVGDVPAIGRPWHEDEDAARIAVESAVEAGTAEIRKLKPNYYNILGSRTLHARPKVVLQENEFRILGKSYL